VTNPPVAAATVTTTTATGTHLANISDETSATYEDPYSFGATLPIPGNRKQTNEKSSKFCFSR